MKYEKDMIFFITEDILEKMKKCVDKAKPHEAFGLILGPEPKEITLDKPEEFQYHSYGEIFECIESNEESPVSFFVDNSERLFEIMENARIKNKRRVLSLFHSHPGGAHPSGFDKKYMKFFDELSEVEYKGKQVTKIYKNQIWTIMNAENKVLNGFIYLEKEFMQINIQILS
ncbi:MAG: Mov34/MPN/PAD-1 family protein [Promethearchaeota archaeon]